MKGLLLLGLVGASIYGALVLTDDLLPRDPAKEAFARQSLGDPSDRQLRSWGTDLPALASSSSQRASVNLRSPLPLFSILWTSSGSSFRTCGTLVRLSLCLPHYFNRGGVTGPGR